MNIRLLAAVALVTTVCSAWAEALDLKGSDCEVTSLSGYESVCNSGAAATLTVNLAADETFSRTISGPVKLVKTGTKTLTLSGDNTYTGGTEINGGKLIAGSATAFGIPTDNAAVQVNSDCTPASASESGVTAVGIAVTTFGYNLNFSDWDDHMGRPKTTGQDGYKAMYNVWVCVGNVTMSGKLTGGDVAIRQASNAWGGIDKVAALTISGDVELTGTFYVANRGQACTVTGQMKVGAIKLSQNTTPSVLNLKHADNEIGEIDVGRYWSAGGITCAAVNALGGAKLYSTSDDTGATAPFTLDGYSQTVDYPFMVLDTKGKDYGGSADGLRHYIVSSKAATLTMNASGDALNDWMFRDKVSLVWNPSGDYAITNVYRAHTMTGTITVNKGGFYVKGDDCSFEAITGLTVGENAVVALEEGGTLRSDGNVPVVIAESSKLKIDDDWTWSVKSLKVGANYLESGTYAASAGEGVAQLSQLEGAGKIVVLMQPADPKTVTWTGGGDDDKATTAANWKNGSKPSFGAGTDELVLAESGDRMELDKDASVMDVRFTATNGFTVCGEKKLSIVAEAGISTGYAEVTNPISYTISAPLTVAATQDWTVNSNVTLQIRGQLNYSGLGAQPTLNLKGGGYVDILAVEGSTFNGPVAYGEVPIPNSDRYDCPYLRLTGVNPIGTNRVTISGLASGKNDKGHDPQLILNGADLANPIYLKSHYQTHIYTENGTTNRLRSAINTSTVDFAPVFHLGGKSELVLDGESDLAASPNAYAGLVWKVLPTNGEGQYSSLIMNGRMTYKYTMTYDGTVGDTWFNASSNAIAAINANNNTGRWHFNADYAFSDGLTALTPAVNSGRTTTIDLHGHPQHVGSLGRGNSMTAIFSSEGAATLRINQTTDVTFAGTFGADLEVVKEGAAKFAFGNETPFDLNKQNGTVLVLKEGTVSFPAAGAKVRQLKYVDAGGESRFVERGVYTKDNAPDAIKGFFADDSGPLTVCRGEFPPGLLIMVK